MAHCWSPRAPWPPSRCSSSPLLRISNCQLALPVLKRTILGFPEARFDVIEREIAHLVFEAVEIHRVGGGCDMQVENEVSR